MSISETIDILEDWYGDIEFKRDNFYFKIYLKMIIIHAIIL